jgi:hypothetical protein
MTTTTPQDDALTFQANQTPDDLSDAPDDDTEDPEDRASNAARTHHQPHKGGKFDFPRPSERPPVIAPTRPVLRVPDAPKSLNGKRLTKSTLPRDRDMLESRKMRG